ncbi:amidohydrolase [Streptacidiphilus rugosus]|uniref:amidohydrolase n=1 Tax=Streptacidiphilus rugosus TaxID=405783 RepID=UPI000567968E|nr:amidohydrolase [Streptacidiphilus rugosus]
MNHYADLIVHNAHVHTVDPDLPRAEAVAVRDGRIVQVFAEAAGTRDWSAWVGPETRVVDADGRLLLPGFVDSHNHVRLGSDGACVQLAGAGTLEEIGRRIRHWLAANPDAEWVEAEAFDYTAIPAGRMPTAGDLDTFTGDRPAFVLSYDVHTAWLNSAALRRLGIDASVDRTTYGTVQKDPVTGEPTGFLTDFAVRGLSRDGHRALVAAGVPWAHPDRQYARLCGSLDMAARYGITTVVEPQNSLDDLALYERARGAGRLRSRLVVGLFHPRGTTDAELAEYAEAGRLHSGDRFRVGPLKLYIDDVVEPHTAALLEPYAGHHSHRGETFYPPEEFAETFARLDGLGFQLFVHATGDRGIRTVLDAAEYARKVNGVPEEAEQSEGAGSRGGRRHQVVHVECLDPADVPRFAELDVVACMQPRHCSPDIAGPGQDWANAVGPGRWSKAWPMRSLHEAGARLALSSDWNVAEMDPMVGLYTAVTRQGLAGGPAWQPEQTLDLATALHGYTMGGAYANHLEDRLGSITVGKYADLVLLSRDLFAIEDPRTILDTVVDLSVLDGEIVHDTGV